MVAKVSEPYPVFYDLEGEPLEAGYIYIGEYALNPVGNPKAAYWDAALTIPAAQPIRTIAGRPSNEGAQLGVIYVENKYSILVQDNLEQTVVSDDVETSQTFAERAEAAAAEAEAILAQLPLVDGILTVYVPTDFATLQAALDAVAAYRHNGSGETRITLEAGYEGAAQTTTFGGEFSNARIVSESALPTISASFPAVDTLMSYENCVAPVWNTLVDMEGRGNNGVYIGQGAGMVMAAGSGVVNAGANGDNPNGAALLILGGTVNVKYDASLASGFVADGAARRGVWATIGGSFAGKFGSYENVGTDPAISEGNASIFGSRNGFIYDDNCSFDGSVRGIRNGGATVQARDVPSSTIKGHVAWTFLGGTTLMEQGVTPDSGWNGDWSVYGSNYSDRVDISSAESAATDLDLNGDGSKMFVIGANGDDITEWSLVGAYDFDGKVLNGAFSVASEETAPTSLDFRSDGQRVAVIGTASDSIHRYNLSTGYDVTSTVTLIESVSISAWTTSPQAIRVSEDRLKAFVLDISGTLHEFTLASEFTFTGMTLAASHDFTAYGSDFRAFDFADAGSKLVLVGRADDRLLEFDLSTAYNPATAIYGRYDWLKSPGANNLYTANTLTGFRYSSSTRFFFTGESSGVDHVWKYVTQNYPLFYVGGVASDRSQGGGTIIAESASVNGALWTIAEVDTPSGTINIDDIVSATGLLGPVATITGGLVSAQRSVFVSSANSVAPQMVLISDAGEFEGTGSTLDGGGVVPYLVAVTENGRAHLRGAKLLNPATKLFDFRDGSGEIFLHDNTINGVAGKFPNGVILGDGANFATRAEAVDAITYGFRLADGKRFVAAGLSYEFLDGAVYLSDMLGVVPSGLLSAYHFKEAYGVADAATYFDDTPALRALHSYANATGHHVSYDGVPLVAAQHDALIAVSTDFDLGRTKVHPLGGIQGGVISASTSTWVFEVVDADAPLVTGSTVVGGGAGEVPASDLGAGSTAFSQLILNGPGFIEASFLGGPLAPNRDGDGTQTYKFSTESTDNGVSVYPLPADCSTATSVNWSARATPVKGLLNISGGHFDPNEVNSGGLFLISRCNVEFEGQAIIPISGETTVDSYNRIYSTNFVSGITFKNITAVAQKNNGGTYVWHVTNCATVLIDNCGGEGDDKWGCIGGDLATGLTVRNSRLNRVDGHFSCHYYDVRGCNISDIGCVMGTGSNWKIIGNSFRDCPAFELRGDYGGGDCSGYLIVENNVCTFSAFRGTHVVLGDSANPVGFPGYTTRMFDYIRVEDGVRMTGDGRTGNRYFQILDMAIAADAQGVNAPQRIEVAGCGVSERGRTGISLGLMNMIRLDASEPTSVKIDGVYQNNTGLTELEGLYMYPRVVAGASNMEVDMAVTNCNRLGINMDAMGSSQIDCAISDSQITRADFSGDARVIMQGGKLLVPNLVGAETAAVFGSAPTATSDYLHMFNVLVEGAWDLSYIRVTARIIYASVSGTGSGDTSGNSTNLDTACKYVRALMLVSENTDFTIQLTGDTFTPTVRNQLDDGTWSFGTNQLNILGVDTGGAEPTTIISGASLSSGWFTKYSEISRPVNLNVRDIKLTGFNSSKPFVLRYGGGRWASSNLWSTGTFGLLELRGFYCEVRGSDAATPTEITGHTTGAIILMDCYYEVGDNSGLGGTGVIDFNGTGDNVLVSRRSVGYVRSCVFTAGATHVTIGRLARLRTQSNSFAGWTVAAIEREDASAIWNNDSSNLDTIDASSLTTSTPFLRTGAVGMTPWSKGSTWEPHTQLHGCAASIASNSSEVDRDITEVANGGLEELGPRPPEFFLFSQTSAIRLAYDITLSDTNGATMKVFAGTALLGSITLPSAAGVRDFRVFFEINGGSSTVATGTFSAIAYGDGSVVASNAGSTVSLATGSARGASVAELDWKVTATQTNGTGTLLPKAFNCELTF